ncbi:MAG: hypothetical protein ACR2MX_00365 [Cyclobacteriaceae bacterium]
MMKLIKYILPTVALLIVLAACEDEPRFELADTDKSLNMRLVSSQTSFDATNPNDMATIRFFSENNENGDLSNISKVDLYVEHFVLLDNTTSPRVLFTSIDGASVTNDGSLSLDVPLTEIASKLGIDVTDISGGDIITFYNITTLADGRVYPDTVLRGTDFETVNTTPNVLNSAPTTSFTATVAYPIVCPLEEGFATGQYLLEQLVPLDPPYFGLTQVWAPEVVAVTAIDNTTRTFTAVNYLGGFNSPFTISLACNVVLMPEQAFPVGCNANITAGQDLNNIGTFDITDDSEFTIGILHDPAQDCGQGTAPTVLRLTKQ